MCWFDTEIVFKKFARAYNTYVNAITVLPVLFSCPSPNFYYISRFLCLQIILFSFSIFITEANAFCPCLKTPMATELKRYKAACSSGAGTQYLHSSYTLVNHVWPLVRISFWFSGRLTGYFISQSNNEPDGISLWPIWKMLQSELILSHWAGYINDVKDWFGR